MISLRANRYFAGSLAHWDAVGKSKKFLTMYFVNWSNITSGFSSTSIFNCMIKRNPKNIGKEIRISCLNPVWNDRLGKVISFRGNFEKGDPYVEVFVYDKNNKRKSSIYPFTGHLLYKI